MTQTVEELEKAVEELRVRNKVLQDELKAKQVVKVVQTTQKLRHYSGDAKDLKKWIADCKRQISLQSVSEKNSVDFILSHLEGDAEDEVKFDLDEATCTSTDIFDTLLGAFGEQVTAADILDQCYARQQGDKEGLRDYAYGLMKLTERALCLDGTCISDKDTFLRDRFIQKVKDRHLRDYLRAEIRKNPSLKFRDIREEALLYAEEDRKPHSKKVTCHQVEVRPENQQPLTPPTTVEKGAVSNSSLEEKIGQLLEMQTKHQEQLAQQQKLIVNLLTEKAQKSEASNTRKDEKCFFCGKVGHRKKQCYKWKATQKTAKQPLSTTNGPTDGAQAQQFVPQMMYGAPAWQPQMVLPSPCSPHIPQTVPTMPNTNQGTSQIQGSGPLNG